MATDYDLDAADSWPHRGRKERLTEKGLFDELPTIAKAYELNDRGNRSLGERENLIGPINWE